jgi:hypothetical protein
MRKYQARKFDVTLIASGEEFETGPREVAVLLEQLLTDANGIHLGLTVESVTLIRGPQDDDPAKSQQEKP